ncbi:unnamed protein product [Linum trigynum]|uniref:F-box domain-containing protein n=1 Tax=Linum trigynum TaxID=586398 RepID=A0AAV2FHS1_9ROSI
MVKAVRGSGSRGGEDGEDRISQLPEEIIHSILNRLKSSEEAAKTSVLSRRWLQLWRRYPFFQFNLSKSKNNFHSFVASSSRKLLPWSSSDSGHSCCATIQDFRISLREYDDDFPEEDLDRLLSLIADHANGLSPVKFLLHVQQLRSYPSSYSLRWVPNWTRTKSVSLSGCDLTSVTAAAAAFGDQDNHSNGLAYLGSLERLSLVNVNLSEQLLHWFLDNAPRLMWLSLRIVYGIDKLEVVSSPLLQSLQLCCISRSKNRSERMRRLRISSPKLKRLLMWSGLEELEIDAPDLVSLFWTVFPDDPVTKVNLVNLASTCRSEIRVSSPAISCSPQWLRVSLSAAFSQLQRLNLVFYFSIDLVLEKVWFDLSQAEYDFAPRAIDQVRFVATWSYILNNDAAARFLELFFSICHPEFMSINVCHDGHQRVVQYMCDEYLMTGSPDGVNIATSWRHHLTDMKIKDEITGDVMEISEDTISSLANRKTVRFMFTWC